MTPAPHKANLLGKTAEELTQLLSEMGMASFRGRQVFQWLYKYRCGSFPEMTNLAKKDRETLERTARIFKPKILERLQTPDGTEKFLYGMEDGHSVEGVLIPEEKRRTLCISTQVGCAMQCEFCLTGKSGLIRNLTSPEIVGEVLTVQDLLPPDNRITHLVIMGMGEPLANYEAVVRALRIFLDPAGFDFSNRKITLSTCGLVPAIEKLAHERLGINLAVSLNAADDETRNRIMPINRTYPLDLLLRTLHNFPLQRRRRITFEYVLLRGINDSREDALKLTRILRGILCKVNLIPFNPIAGSKFEPPARNEVEAFRDFLLAANYTAMIRESRGGEISAACGQLKEQPCRASLLVNNGQSEWKKA
jgi:23S rRNA (adenine2503-C2)-methyltransferase